MAVREALIAAGPGELLAGVAAAPAAAELEVRLGVVTGVCRHLGYTA